MQQEEIELTNALANEPDNCDAWDHYQNWLRNSNYQSAAAGLRIIYQNHLINPHTIQFASGKGMVSALTSLTDQECAFLARQESLTKLRLFPTYGHETGEKLATQPWLSRIEHLAFEYNDDGLRHALKGFFQHASDPKLKRLDLIGKAFEENSTQLTIDPQSLFYGPCTASIEQIHYIPRVAMSADQSQRIAREFFKAYQSALGLYIDQLKSDNMKDKILDRHFRLLSLSQVNGVDVPQNIARLQHEAINLQKSQQIDLPYTRMTPEGGASPSAGAGIEP